MAFFKKKTDEEKQVQQTFLFPDSIVYTRYDLNASERVLCLAGGFVAGFALGWIFYGMLVISLITGVAVAAATQPLYRKFMLDRRMKQLKLQFRDMLEAVATSIGAGQNVTDAFMSAYGDLRTQYTENAYIVQELANIVGGMNNNINIEVLLNDFAARSGLDDAASFASVFETAYRKGGNIKEVVKSTYEVINEKVEVDMEIQTMVASARTELNMMLAMPVVIILMLRFMGSDFSGQGTMVSILATTAALVIFAVAYFVGRKIMAIKL